MIDCCDAAHHGIQVITAVEAECPLCRALNAFEQLARHVELNLRNICSAEARQILKRNIARQRQRVRGEDLP